MASPIVSVETLAGWLAERRPGLRICDVRWYLGQPAGSGRAAYDAGHIPGAIHVDLDTELVAPVGPGRHPLPEPAVFAAAMAARGIGDGDTVVAYDDVGGWVAARLWWMLDDLGHARVSVLDGGIQAWAAAGGPLTAVVPAPEPGRLSLRDRWTRTIDRAGLVERLGAVRLIDARAAERYRGDLEPVDAAPGHIPTARSLPTAGSLGPDGRFLPPHALRARFEAGHAGAIDAETEVVTSCGSGVTACHSALAMRIAGLPDPILYPGSYSDWSRAGLPVATGDEPGEVPASLRR
jgi:thiosulfate/3-mercaptopyruvate sulfurtransferase